MAIESPAHPTPGRLQAFRDGLLAGSEAQELDSHVTACTDCQAVLDTLPDDDLVIRCGKAGAAINLAGPFPDVTGKLAKGAHALLAGPGDQLGDFRLVEKIDEGGMGVVFKAVDTRLPDRPAAIKTMSPESMNDPSARARFQDEAQAMSRVKNDHVATIYQVGLSDSGVPFIAMEYVPGKNLKDRVKRAGRPSIPEVIRIGREIAEGLGAIHDKGLVHRDIKPANVILEEAPYAGRVKLIDFGVVRDNVRKPDGTGGLIIGTPAYMAPEQAAGEKVSPSCDLYALGCVLYFLCTGVEPFARRTALATLQAVATDLPKPPQRLNPAVPCRLSNLIMRLLAKAPEDRPASTSEFLGALAAVEPSTRPPRPARRRWAVAAAALLLALVPLGALYGPAVFRIATNKGVLVVETGDEAVEVEVKGQGATIIDPGTKREIWVNAGDVEIEVKEKNGLHLFTKAFTLSRDGKEVVNVRYELTRAKPPDRPPPQPPAGSPFDLLDPARIPEKERYTGQPRELVAVLVPAAADRRGGSSGITVSPDGRVIAGGCTPDPEGLVYLWETATGKKRRLKAMLSVAAVAFSPDGKLLAGAGLYQARLWDLGTGKALDVVPLKGVCPPHALAFSPDGKLLAVADGFGYRFPDKRLLVWDVEKRKEYAVLDRPRADDSTFVAFSPNGKTLAILGHWNHRLTLWNVARGEAEASYDLKAEPVVGGLAYSPDGRTLACACGDHEVALLDPGTGEVRRRLPTPGKEANLHLSFSPDGKMLAASGGGDSLIVWETSTYRKLCELTTPNRAGPVAFAPDSRHLVVGVANGAVLVFRLAPPPWPPEDGLTIRPTDRPPRLAALPRRPDPVAVERNPCAASVPRPRRMPHEEGARVDPAWFHPDRAAGGDRHRRRAHRPAAACRPEGP
jgi:hypothetical protein